MSLEHHLKRALDVALAGGGLLAMSPLMLGIAAAIKLDSPGSALFTQERLGRNGRTFRLFKFRTMRAAPIRYNPDGSTRIDANDDRITRVGRYLRGALDELPQLVNVVRGEMSLVGPRPDLPHHRALYTPGEERKLDVRPGITSLPVVLGRNDVPWKDRIAIDIQYIERWSLWLDLKIMLQTIAMPLGLRPFGFDDVLGAGSDPRSVTAGSSFARPRE